jgi:hypothetical protein
MGLFMLASVASAPVRFRVPSSHLDVQFPQGKINFSQKFPRQQLPPDNKLLPDSATRQIAGSKFLHSQGEPLATHDSAILTWPPVGVTKQKCIPRFPPCSEVATIKSVVVAELDSVRGLCLSVVSRPKEATQESGSCTTPRIAWCGYCLTRKQFVRRPIVHRSIARMGRVPAFYRTASAVVWLRLVRQKCGSARGSESGHDWRELVVG